jgi:small-conductance mechanosensitive channel
VLVHVEAPRARWPTTDTRTVFMNNIIYIVGLIVIVLAVLSLLGLG